MKLPTTDEAYEQLMTAVEAEIERRRDRLWLAGQALPAALAYCLEQWRDGRYGPLGGGVAARMHDDAARTAVDAADALLRALAPAKGAEHENRDEAER